GPPIENVIFATGKGRAWGLTNIPITYDPPLSNANDLAVVKEDKAEGPDLSVCWVQKSPARQLVNLKGIPTLILVSEASYHAAFDHCTARWLNQAVDRGGAMRAFRMDDRKQRLIFDGGFADGEQFFGWEVADATALDALAARLEKAGVAVRRESRAVADQRCATEVISFRDPAGN